MDEGQALIMAASYSHRPRPEGAANTAPVPKALVLRVQRYVRLYGVTRSIERLHVGEATLCALRDYGRVRRDVIARIAEQLDAEGVP